jgi:hypothetical protein
MARIEDEAITIECGHGAMMDLDKAWGSMDDVVGALSALEAEWSRVQDRRIVFASVYRMMSEAVRERIRQRGFEDNVWAERYAVVFANLYRTALRGYEAGTISAVPKSWRISLDASKNGTALVIQDLLLGMNAHINHDLALALRDVGITPRDQRYRDHAAVNTILNAIMEEVQDRVAAMYARGLSDIDRWSGRLDEDVAGFGLTAARENAWTFGVALRSARLELERRLIRVVLDRSAAVFARGILALSGNPQMGSKLRQVEQGTGWLQIWCSSQAERGT